MEVELKLIDNYKFQAKSSKGEFILNCEEISPVEYFAIGTIGCTAYDLKYFAQKDGYEIRDYSVKAEIERSGGVPYKFKAIHIIYKFKSDFEDIKAKRYILASLESYCTTVNSIRDSVKVNYSIDYNDKLIVDKESIISGSSSSSEAIIEDGFGGACCS